MLKKSSGTLTQPYHLRLKRHITHDRKHRLENPPRFDTLLSCSATAFHQIQTAERQLWKREKTNHQTHTSVTRELKTCRHTRPHNTQTLQKRWKTLRWTRGFSPNISEPSECSLPSSSSFQCKKWAQSNITAACQTISGSGPFFLLHLGNSLLLCVPCSASLRWF